MDKNATLFYSGYSGITESLIAQALGKTFNASEQAYITNTIAAIEMLFARKCDRNLLVTDGEETPTDINYFETFDSGINLYPVFNQPIKAVKKIYLDGVLKYDADSEANDWVLGTDFYAYPDKVYFPNASDPGNRALKIYYTIEQFWGDDVILAIKQWVTSIFTQKEFGKTLTSYSFSGVSYSFKSEDIPGYVLEVINEYRKITL